MGTFRMGTLLCFVSRCFSLPKLSEIIRAGGQEFLRKKKPPSQLLQSTLHFIEAFRASFYCRVVLRVTRCRVLKLRMLTRPLSHGVHGMFQSSPRSNMVQVQSEMVHEAQKTSIRDRRSPCSFRDFAPHTLGILLVQPFFRICRWRGGLKYDR